MPIARTLTTYLDEHHVHYEPVAHAHTESSMDSAQAAHVPSHQLAKAVVLEDESGYVVCVVPASNRLNLDWVNEELQRRLHLAEESKLTRLFDDCELGAIPAVASAYGLPVLWDDQLSGAPDVYIEAGDHEHLLHLDGSEFESLMARMPHAVISASGAYSNRV